MIVSSFTVRASKVIEEDDVLVVALAEDAREPGRSRAAMQREAAGRGPRRPAGPRLW